MSDKRDPIDGFISEINASLKQPNPAAFLRRVNAERLLILMVNELMEEHPAESIRILPDNRLAGNAGADFLLQVDDYEMRLALLDSPDRRVILDQDHLKQYKKLLEENSSTLVLILVWTTEDLDSIALSLARIRYLEANPEKLSILLRQTKPIKELISEQIERQTKKWDVDLSPNANTKGRSVDLYKIFSDEIGKAFDAEVNRRYHNDERRRAARQFPVQQEEQLILSVLQNALQGMEADKLSNRLIHIQKRGAR